ncbi:SDR family NAD(P)-dependent oxidoreductase [Methylobacterium sp. E-005]|uniref:SDR family NAD(P)-dependent oxidoreductase n=1 Tax=Methylobacterium sp. E-005 TaxID=2836549 RepID=UPI0024439C1A|nr:SDR family NAD(P)-dependent oxidoreductase [Methylobacterium sp. E-005]
MRDITGQVAWVTGAGSGIGQAAALALAQAGMRVAVTGRGRDNLEHTADLVRAAGGEALVAPADMGRGRRRAACLGGRL